MRNEENEEKGKIKQKGSLLNGVRPMVGPFFLNYLSNEKIMDKTAYAGNKAIKSMKDKGNGISNKEFLQLFKDR